MEKFPLVFMYCPKQTYWTLYSHMLLMLGKRTALASILVEYTQKSLDRNCMVTLAKDSFTDSSTSLLHTKVYRKPPVCACSDATYMSEKRVKILRYLLVYSIAECMYVRMYACMYMYVCIYVRRCVYICIYYVCMYVCRYSS